VKPAYLEKEFTSIAQVREPSMSKIDLGTLGERMNGAYAASKTMIEPTSLACATRRSSCSLVAASPVGLLGEQK